MCVLCNQLWIEDHWSEVASEEQPDAVDGVIALEGPEVDTSERMPPINGLIGEGRCPEGFTIIRDAT